METYQTVKSRTLPLSPSLSLCSRIRHRDLACLPRLCVSVSLLARSVTERDGRLQRGCRAPIAPWQNNRGSVAQTQMFPPDSRGAELSTLSGPNRGVAPRFVTHCSVKQLLQILTAAVHVRTDDGPFLLEPVVLTAR